MYIFGVFFAKKKLLFKCNLSHPTHLTHWKQDFVITHLFSAFTYIKLAHPQSSEPPRGAALGLCADKGTRAEGTARTDSSLQGKWYIWNLWEEPRFCCSDGKSFTDAG